jgi:hypothetical protein
MIFTPQGVFGILTKRHGREFNVSTNPFFDHETVDSEKQLIEDLTIEAIQINGSDMIYLPRELVSEDFLYGEDQQSAFESGYWLEIYVENVAAFGGEHEFFAKFGLEVRDEAVFVASKRRFQEQVQHLEHAREGDLIYWPLSKKLFEIKHVDYENPFYNLGQLHTYRMTVQLFRYAQEEFETGIPEVDEVDFNRGYGGQMVFDAAGVGDFDQGETVFAGVDLGTATAKAVVAFWDPDNFLLVVNKIVGTFADGDVVQNKALTASWTIAVDGAPPIANVPLDAGADNFDIQKESDTIINFDEDNPFGEP